MVTELGSTAVRMLGSLMLVVGVILLLFFLARRLKLRTSFRSADAPEMRLVETLNLAPKRGLALVEFSGQWLIVGVGAESVSLIARMDRPPGAAEGDHAVRTPKGSFQNQVAGLLMKWKRAEGGSEKP